MRFSWSGVVLAFLACPLVQASEPAPGSCEGMVGVWDYAEPSGQGRSVLTRLGDNYTFAYFLTTSTQKGPAANPSTEAAKAAAYDALGAGAWEFTCEGSGGKLRWKGRILYSAKPADVGTTPMLDMEVNGDSARWWFIGADGKRGTMGAAKRAR